MSDLVAYDPAVALERAADPGEFVLLAAERAKEWLAEALAHNDLDALVNVKGWAETLRVATAQKQLGKDAELTAQELVRRAERCIGLGIREGQRRGEITSSGVRVSAHPDRSISRVSDYVSPHEATSHYGSNGKVGIYALSDNGTDDDFEQAITQAKAEGNLSRANVVRKLTGRTPPPPERHPIHHRARRIDPERIVNESIAILEGVASSLALIEDVQSLDAEQRLLWLDAIREPLSAINRFKKELAR